MLANYTATTMNTDTPVYIKDPTTQDEYIRIDEQLRVVKCVVSRDGSNLKGAVYHIPQYDSLDAVLEKFGSDVVLDSINAIIAQRMWQKTANKVKPETADPVQIQKHYENLLAADPVIGSVQDAVDFKLGQRDLSLSALGRAVPKAIKALTEATMSGDVTKIAEATAALNDILAKFQRASQEATKLAQAAIA